VKYPTEKQVLKNLGKRIVLLRKERNISQSNLCYEIDIDLSTLSRLERGVLNVTHNTLYKTAKVF
jgi:transcriptional regulator with XRE-family HTH domain